MRALTASQKKILKNWIATQVNPKDSWERTVSVFKGNNHSLGLDELPNELWGKIEAINDTEILGQEVERYMSDECSRIIHED